MDAEICSLLVQVKAAYSSIESVWLIGSRANGSASETSDWDFIVFANRETLEHLRSTVEFHRANVDFLVVVNGEDFENAWGEKDKTGALSAWEWKLVTDAHAEYTETKWVETEENAKVVLQRRKAIRV
ncbi:MAG: nucleotidyltransferase domain-containing protein [Pseudomonadota bacterium]